jgi:hypothetical protein
VTNTCPPISATLNGAYPAGSDASWNMPVSGSRVNDPLNTSMRLSWKFAASNSGPDELGSSASPL